MDELARLGSAATTGDTVNVPLAMQVFKTRIKQSISQLHQHRWLDTPGNRITKLWFPHIDRKKSRAIMNLSKTDLRLMMTILTGHCDLAYFQTKINNIDDATCSICSTEDETVEHFMCRCPIFMRLRHITFGQHIIDETDISLLPIDLVVKYTKQSTRFNYDGDN